MRLKIVAGRGLSVDLERLTSGPPIEAMLPNGFTGCKSLKTAIFHADSQLSP
jgi:hypothetical protein